MAKVIPFPIVRRHPHVLLCRDEAWNNYRVEAVHVAANPGILKWFDDVADAFDHALYVAEKTGLPVIDLTVGRGAAA